MGGRQRVSIATVAVSALVAVIMGTGSAVFANHQFPDVATGSFFHESVSAMYDAGCYSGIDGQFKPKDNPTRGQFAYWLYNCSSRSGTSASGFFVALGPAGGDPQALLPGPVAVTSGGLDDRGAFASLDLTSAAFSASCDNCEYTVALLAGETVIGVFYLETSLAAAAGPGADDDDNGSVLASGVVYGNAEFSAVVRISDPDATGGNASFSTQLQVITTPLDLAGLGGGLPPAPMASAAIEMDGGGSFVPLTPLPVTKG